MTSKRAIYRLEGLKNWFKEDSEQYIAIDKAIEALQYVESVGPNVSENPTGWTPVSEGLPLEKGNYLITQSLIRRNSNDKDDQRRSH